MTSPLEALDQILPAPKVNGTLPGDVMPPAGLDVQGGMVPQPGADISLRPAPEPPSATGEAGATLAPGPAVGDTIEPRIRSALDAVFDERRQRDQTVRANILQAQGREPDKVAKAIKLGAQLGMPAEAVEQNLPQIQAEAEVNEWGAWSRNREGVQNWLEDTTNAALVAKEWQKISFLDNALSKLEESYLSSRLGAESVAGAISGRRLAELQAAEAKVARGEFVSPMEREMVRQAAEVRRNAGAQLGSAVGNIAEIQARLAQMPKRPAMVELEAAQNVGDVFAALGKDPGIIWDLALQNSIQLGTTTVAGIAAGATMGPAGAVAMVPFTWGQSFAMEFSSGILDKMADLGVDTSDPNMVKAAFQDRGMMEKVFEAAAAKAAVVAGIDAATMGVASKTLAPAMRSRLGREAVNLPAQMAVQMAGGAGGEYLGEKAAGGEATIADMAKEAIAELSSAPADVLAMRGAAGADRARKARETRLKALVGKLKGADEVAIAESDAKAVDQLIAAADQTDLAKRSPDKLAELLNALQGEQQRDVHVPAEAVQTFLQSKPIDQQRATTEALGITEQLPEALARGGDIVIPLARYVTEAGRTGAHEAWREQMRLDADGVSIAQAREDAKVRETRSKELLARAEEQIQAGIAELDATQRVEDDALAWFKSVGFTPDVAAQYATLVAQRAQARAARSPDLYADAWEAWSKAGPGTGLELRSDLPPSVRAMPPDRLDALLNSIRDGEVKPTQDADANAKFAADRAELAKALDEHKINVATQTNAQIRRAMDRVIAEARTRPQVKPEVAAIAGMSRPELTAMLADLRAPAVGEAPFEEIAGPPTYEEQVASLKAALPDSAKVPETFTPEKPLLDMAKRLAKGWGPEKHVAKPQSLTDFVRKNGGLDKDSPEAGNLLAQDIGKQPGLLQKRRRRAGYGFDVMAEKAKDMGYDIGPDTGIGNGINADRFMEMLVEDATGRQKHYPADEHTAAWQAQQEYFDQFNQWLKHELEWEPKGRDPREIAWFLSQDAGTQRLMALAERLDDLGPETSLEAMNLLAAVEPGATADGNVSADGAAREVPADGRGQRGVDIRAALDALGLDPAKLSDDEIVDRIGQALAAGGRTLQQVDTASEAFKRWFANSKIVDENGAPLRMYRGDFRDTGAVLKKNRTESARFYFTGDPEVASNYATGKPYVDPDRAEDYADYFLFPAPKGLRRKLNLTQQWFYLSQDQREQVKDALLRARLDDDGTLIFSDERDGGIFGSVSHWDYYLREARGNWLEAGKEAWLNSGALFNEEERFVDILHKAGLRNVEFDDPRQGRPVVTPVYLSIQNPVDTTAITREFVERLAARLKGDRTHRKGGGHAWNKNNVTPREWLADLQRAFDEKGQETADVSDSFVWTSIPDRVVLAMQQMGYDGIDDRGAKGAPAGSGIPHRVVIAFEPQQVKSAISNTTFDPRRPSILQQGRRVDTEPPGPVLLETTPATPEQLAARQRAREREEAEARMRGRAKGKAGQQSADDLPLFGGERQGQLFQDASRGSIHFTAARTVIAFTQSRDFSTAIHELGHLWLSELEFDARADGASPQLKADWETIQKALGVENGFVTTEQHEQFAEWFERYAREGKAPSEELRPVFRRFRDWLISIYRSLRGLMANQMPDDVREVFDRMLATDEQIKAVRERQGLNPIFADAKAAGMTKEEFDAYTRRAAAVADETERRLLDKLIQQITRRKTKEWKTEERKVRGEVTAEWAADPTNQALSLLTKGTLAAGETPEVLKGVKLAKNGIVEAYGDEGVLGLLPAGVYRDRGTGPGVMTPDELAEALGISSGRELIERLMQVEAERRQLEAAGDKRTPFRQRVDEETARRMREQHGDPLHDGSIQAEAMAALHIDQQAAFMSSELRVLARRAGVTGVVTLDDIKAWAADAIAQKSVREAVQHEAYARAERQAGQRVERALLKGDLVAAFKAKQDQLVNHALWREAKAAADVVEKGRALLDRYAGTETIKSMDQEYLDQIHQLLERYEFKNRSQAMLARRESFEQWAVKQAAMGHEVIAPPSLPGIFQVNYRQMPLEDFRGLVDTVKQIAHLGRWKQEMLDNKKKREFEAVVSEVVAAIEATPQRGVSRSDRGQTRLRRALGAPGRVLRSLDAGLLKMETMFQWLDGDESGQGPLSRIIFRRLSDAQTRERDMQQKMRERLAKVWDAVPVKQRQRWGEVLEFPELRGRDGLPAKLNRNQLIAAALNTGNESNLQKMLAGEQWEQDALEAVLNRTLTKEEWQFVQDVWSLIDQLWPDVKAMEERVNGVAPPRVEPRTVDTPFGPLKGGYYPMVYDPNSIKGADIKRMQAEGLFDQAYVRATTRAGATRKRTEGFNAPVWLSLGVIGQHINEVSHDIAFREAVIESYKLLSDARVREAVIAALGPEYEAQILPWLKNIANEWAIDKKGVEGWERLAHAARTNTTVTGLGLRITTMLSQTVGYANSAQILGVRWMASGMRAFWKSPIDSTAFIEERSGEMRHRVNDLERDIRAVLQKMEGKGISQFRADVTRFAMRGIALFDAAVSRPTWMGAYNKALSEGMPESDAAHYADKVVRDTQGSGAAKDLAAIQRGGELMKLFTMFYSYFNVLYQRQRSLMRDAREVRSVGEAMDVLAQSWWLLIVPSLLGALATGEGPEDDEDWQDWALRNVIFGNMASVPLLRDVANALNRAAGGKPSFGGVKLSPVQSIYDSAWHTGKDVGKLFADEDVSDTAIKTAFTTAGVFTGMPFGQVGATSQFLWDVLVSGSQDPRTIGEWVAGLSKGKFKD